MCREEWDEQQEGEGEAEGYEQYEILVGQSCAEANQMRIQGSGKKKVQKDEKVLSDLLERYSLYDATLEADSQML